MKTNTLLIAALCSIPLVCTAGQASVGQVAMPARPWRAMRADAAADAVGVNTHLGYLDTYGPVWSTIIRPRLLELGIRHIRDENRDLPLVVSEYRDLADHGITALLINSTYAHSLIDNVKSLNAFKPKFVDAVEPPNERDVASPDWINILTRSQSELWGGYHSDPALAGIWVLGPSFANTRDSPGKFHAGSQDAGSKMDHGNLHDYPGGQWPEGMYGGGWGVPLDRSVAAYREICGDKPLISGETGYHNAVGYGGQPGVSERATAKYMPRLILEHLRRGFVRTYFYELFDQRTDPKDMEQNFGLVRHDGSPKLQFNALQSFIALLSDRGPAFTPGSLSFTLSGDTTDVYTMLFQKRDGRFYLAVWQGVNSFDTRTNKDIEPTPKAVTVTFAKSMGTVHTYLPTFDQGTTPRQSYHNTRSIDLSVPDHLLILEIDPKRSSNAAANVDQKAPMERSYWVHASLGLFTQRGYFGPQFPATDPPTQAEVTQAAHLLTGAYAANRLYLIYHKEMPIEDAIRVFGWWRATCPKQVELVPALVLRMYDRAQTPVFTTGELQRLCATSLLELNPTHAAVYDIYANRDQGASLKLLAKTYPKGLIRLGIQPGEHVASPFISAVEDTWSGMCHGTRNAEDWSTPGFGSETLRSWAVERNHSSAPIVPIAWNLIVVAWDYRATERGGYPGYDDADKNMPLPEGRNRLATTLIRNTAFVPWLRGFSCDLYILNENSRTDRHDGKSGAFYASLKQGKPYSGYFAAPFKEITQIYREMAEEDLGFGPIRFVPAYRSDL